MRTSQEIIARKIRRYRKRTHTSQSEFAFRCEMTDRYLSNIENAQANPSLFKLCKISNAMGIPVHELLQPEDESVES